RLIRGKASDYHVHEDFEQIYFVLEGWGSMLIDGAIHSVAEGDTVQIPPGLRHQIMNENCNGWLSYLVIS
ncbi:MAG: cupin domain-containing protein, partial [Gemmatimonadota bacterium]|nr:cupin domain-containing protein [Gemmatimonadota bacterium]